MSEEQRIVDNQTFLLGLDNLYREAIKPHERGELLQCARQVATVLQVAPATVPVEGYYAEDQQLTEYFCLMRALQDVNDKRRTEVASLPEFQRLLDVTSAPLYGKPMQSDSLLPAGRDALSQALFDTPVSEWNVQRLTETAHRVAKETDDYSLVGLAAYAQNAIVLTALRESVVLYAAVAVGAAAMSQPPKYIWAVDKELAEQARRFIDTFNKLFGDKLPPPEPAQVETYWWAYTNNEISGRCVRIGYNDAVSPTLHYHWAICWKEDGTPDIQEFWHPELWTTERYHAVLFDNWRRPDL
jgi:hypothetical protein